MDPKISNICATIQMVRADVKKNQKHPFDLYELAQKGRNIDYNPRRFPAAFLRIKEPQITGIVYSSGKITIVGSKSVEDCQNGAERLIHIIRESLNLSKNTCYFEDENVKIHNIIAVCELGYELSLDRICEDSSISRFCHQQESFPGVLYHYYDLNKQQIGERKTFILFSNGKVVFTGMKSKKAIQIAFENVKNSLLSMKKKTQVQLL